MEKGKEIFRKNDIIFMDPVCKHNIWGGSRLKDEYGYHVEGNDVGECWGISAHHNGDSRVSHYSMVEREIFAGIEDKDETITLSMLWKNEPELFGSDGTGEFPLLVKIIDAKENLSIQVHPDDSYAQRIEHLPYGKTECWYILDCEEGASLIVGHNASSKEELKDMIEGNKWNDLIRYIPIEKGDFIQINPGTVHAICKNVLLLETQQSSDITYRLYDYGRLQDGKPRELHIEKSVDVIAIPKEKSEYNPTQEVKKIKNKEKNSLEEVYKGIYYNVFSIVVEGNKDLKTEYLEKKCLLCSVIEGEGQIQKHFIKKGDHFIIPAGSDKIHISGNMKMILSNSGDN